MKAPILLIVASLVSFGGNPLTELEELLNAGRASYSKGDYAAARQSLERAWKVAAEAPVEAATQYEILKQLSRVLSAAGLYTEAENYLLQAINVRETVLKAPELQVADDLTEVAVLCRRLKDFPRGLAVLDRVLQIQYRAAGFENPSAADTLGRMAQLHLDQRDHQQAAGALERALRTREKVLGPDHWGLLGDLDRLATVRIAIQEYDKAEDLYRRALLIRERALGPTDADLIPTLEGLAYATFGEKKYDDAETFYKRVLGIWEQGAGKEHPLVALTLDKMATLYREQKRMEDARATEEKANALRAHFLATGLSHEAGEYLANGNRKEAAQLYRRALETLGPPRQELEELRKQIDNSLVEIGAAAPKPAARPKPAHKRKQ